MAILMAMLLIICSVSMVGCGSTPAPVSDRTPPPGQKINHHTVSHGDTLFAIAWRYELSVELLAAANGLTRPYAIYDGQRLTLNTRKIKSSRPLINKAKLVQSLPRQTTRPGTATVVKKNSGQVAAKITRVTRQATYKLPIGKWRWQWPVQGTVSRYYDTNRVFKGLDIIAAKGRVVNTTAPGVVVYAGRGLRGYGQLLIVKHSDVYLSAYAHNRKMYVKEGQTVVAGQKISEVGGDPDNNSRLYFEIRKNGKPVDPMRLLPRL